ncbi:glycosyltransferase family 4 protein [Candidatus Saccharibacteria bacterium]|nr:glycosyltransferase family 4 protein [Candidatus Saccharibacteria bacterium]
MQQSLDEYKIAIVCDWLTNVGGAERVVKSLHEIFPDAPIYTSQYVPERIDWFNEAVVRTGWLNRFPKNMHKFFPVLRGIYFSHLNLRDYDIVISSTGAEAKAVKTRPDALHVSYMHAPTQYYWSLYDQYLEHPGFGKLDPLARIALRLLVRPLRFFDKRFAQRPDAIIANSTYIQNEILMYYERQSTVIFPPVQTDKFSDDTTRSRHGFVTTSRQVPWKRLDLAISACMKTGDSLVIVGDGSEHDRLVEQAKDSPNITFLPTQDLKGLKKILTQSEGFIFPSLEPFGIAPVEALSAGTPVIAYGEGGALDYIDDGVNGLLFSEQTTDSLTDALTRFRSTSFDEKVVKQSAEDFSDELFKEKIIAYITSQVKEKHAKR